MRKFISILISVQLVLAPAFAGPESQPSTATGTRQQPYSQAPNEASDQSQFPALEYSADITNPETGAIEGRLETIYTSGDGVRERNAAEALIKAKIRASAESGERPSIVVFETDEETPSEKINFKPEEWHVKPESVSKLTVVVSKLKSIRNWLTNGRTVDVAANYKKAASSIRNKLDHFIDSLTNEVTNPFYKLGLSKNKTVDRQTFTFAFTRLVLVTGVVATGFIASKDLGLPGLGIALASSFMGVLSAAIQWNYTAFLNVLENLNFVSQIWRKPIQAAARIFGLSKEQREQLDETVKRSAVSRFVNSSGNYVLTEKFFVGPAILIFALFGATLFPGIYDFQDGSVLSIFDTTMTDFIKDSLENAVLLTRELLWFGVKVLGSQGFWDLASGQQLRGRIAEIIRNENLTPAERDKALKRAGFSASLKLMGISVASNLGNVMALPDSEVAKFTGNAIVTSLMVTGLSFYGYTFIRYSEKTKEKLNRFLRWLKFRPCSSLLTK